MDVTAIAKAAYPPELKILSDAAKVRILAARKAQDYYDGNFWRHIEAQARDWEAGSLAKIHKEVKDYPTGSAVGKLDYTPTKLQLKYAKFFIDELASWMFENPISLNTEQENIYNEAMRIHRLNMLDEKLLQSGTEGCLTGGVAAKVLYNDSRGVRIIYRPSRECFPIMDPDDVDVMEKVHFCSLQDDEKTVWRQTFELIDGVCYVTDAWFKLADLKDKDPTPFRRREVALYHNNKPVDFIPVELFPNEPNLGDTWGESDLESLYDPINEFCRKMSDSADALKFELFPITVLMNASESNINDLTVAPGAVWELTGGDSEHPVDVHKLESQLNGLAALEPYINQLKEQLYQFSGVPQTTRDKVESVGNISGVALKLMFTSIVSKCNRKLMYWKPRLARIYDYALRTASVYEDFPYDPKTFDLTVETTPRIPQNEMEQVEIQAKKIEHLLVSVVNAMKTFGVENPEEALAEILAEQQIIAKATNPDIYGAAIEREAME